MSAAFALSSSGPPAPCGFPKCVLEAFHSGDHVFLAPAILKPQRVYTCSECKARFVIYGEIAPGDARTCGSQECILSVARRQATTASLLCACPQRRYAHELSVHANIRSEAYDPTRRHRWPWSLASSPRLEPSTERTSHE